MSEPMGVPAEVPGPPPGLATFGQRFIAFLIDIILLAIVGGVVGFILPDVLAGLIQFVLGIAYFAYLEGSPSGQTVGKRAMSIRVVDFRTRERIDMTRALIRYVGRILSGIPCFLGYFWMLWDNEKQTWHDKIGTTHVVTTAAYPVAEWPG